MAFMNQVAGQTLIAGPGTTLLALRQIYVVFVEDQAQYRLAIDGKTVIDHAEIPKSALAQTVVAMAPGPHKVVLETLRRPVVTAQNAQDRHRAGRHVG